MKNVTNFDFIFIFSSKFEILILQTFLHFSSENKENKKNLVILKVQ